jgi:hypothetical protein
LHHGTLKEEVGDLVLIQLLTFDEAAIGRLEASEIKY